MFYLQWNIKPVSLRLFLVVCIKRLHHFMLRHRLLKLYSEKGNLNPRDDAQMFVDTFPDCTETISHTGLTIYRLYGCWEHFK